MTNAQSQANPARRSRILTSIFARTPRDMIRIGQNDSGTRHRAAASAHLNTRRPQAETWREVANGAARQSLAEKLCTWFFGAADADGPALGESAVAREFMTAGQCLESLSAGAAQACTGDGQYAGRLGTSVTQAGLHDRDEIGSSGQTAASLITAKAA